jgi:cell division protein FtsW
MKYYNHITHKPFFAKFDRYFRLPKFDPIFFAITIALILFSLIMIYSTTGIGTSGSGGDEYYFVKRQFIACVIGLILMLIASSFRLETLRRISPWCLGIALFLLLSTHVAGIAEDAGGARRWVRLGPLRFQPGEFAKLFFLIFLAGYYGRHESRLRYFKVGIVKPFLLLAPLCFLFLLQPDFGSTVTLLGLTLIMGIVAGVSIGHIFLCATATAGALLPLVLYSPYRMRRIMAFMYPESDVSGKGYQLFQSLIAIGSGEIFGVGVGHSQQKLHYLPAAHTDFIFSVIGEELGFIGCITLLLVFFSFMLRGIRIAQRLSHDPFACTLTIGMSMLIVLPAMLNVAVVTGLLPTKGMVLPFTGYGGSNLMMSMFAVGILFSLYRHMLSKL